MKNNWKKIKNKVKNFFKVIPNYLSALCYPKNFIFCCKYPFMKVYNVCEGYFLGYSTTWYDDIPEGWQKAFGQQLLNDIVKALRQDKISKRKWHKNVYWEDIKEKYGTLRLYCCTTDKVQNVLTKYEYLSMGYCMNCGAPAKYCTKGWIRYLCSECCHELHIPISSLHRLKPIDVPEVTCYRENGESYILSLKDEYNIDLPALWK